MAAHKLISPLEGTASALETVLKRDRAVVLAGLLALSALAWAYMAHEARAIANWKPPRLPVRIKPT